MRWSPRKNWALCKIQSKGCMLDSMLINLNPEITWEKQLMNILNPLFGRRGVE
jgi:hypothetical protein